MNQPPVKKNLFQELDQFVALAREMRAAQIAYEEKRGYGTLTRLPLQAKAESLEAKFDQLLDNYPET